MQWRVPGPGSLSRPFCIVVGDESGWRMIKECGPSCVMEKRVVLDVEGATNG